MIELRISSPEQITVEQAEQFFLELGLDTSIQRTWNVVSGRRELGFVFLLPQCDPSDFRERVWPRMRECWRLSCGWMDASSRSFRGCTENFCRPSACPAVATSAAATASNSSARFEAAD